MAAALRPTHASTFDFSVKNQEVHPRYCANKIFCVQVHFPRTPVCPKVFTGRGRFRDDAESVPLLRTSHPYGRVHKAEKQYASTRRASLSTGAPTMLDLTCAKLGGEASNVKLCTWPAFPPVEYRPVSPGTREAALARRRMENLLFACRRSSQIPPQIFLEARASALFH